MGLNVSKNIAYDAFQLVWFIMHGQHHLIPRKAFDTKQEYQSIINPDVYHCGGGGADITS